MFDYPAKFEAQPEGGFTVSFRDIPEAITQGDTKDKALLQAVGALVSAMDFYVEDRRTVPSPSRARRGEIKVALPASISTKVLLLNLMIEENKLPDDLAVTMGLKPRR